MSIALVHSRALSGMLAPAVAVEVHLANGLPAITLVGLPEAAVREARERVRAALNSCGFEVPNRRITVNLAPADLPKESGRFDLPIAVGILAASGQLPTAALEHFELAGELSLSGTLRPIRGSLAMTCAVAGGPPAARPRRGFILPLANADEAALVGGLSVHGARDLAEVVAHLRAEAGDREAARIPPHLGERLPPSEPFPDLADVRGQLAARRALEIAAAGGHHLLLVGPPGAGKSMLAQRLPSLLPPLSREQALESAAVLSLCGRFASTDWGRRSFRSPHHTASAIALVGGGSRALAGEVSLAHHGVLFLDELPEFARGALESLREPLESGRVTVARAARHVDYPARFQLVAAMNPCPCGYLGHRRVACRCTPEQVVRYQGRVSGPLLDRIDLQVEVAALDVQELLAAEPGESSAPVAARAAAARERSLVRQGRPNAHLSVAGLERCGRPDGRATALLHAAAARLGWSGRAVHAALKVARTIADLAGEDAPGTPHLAEAIQYRRALRVS